MASTLQFDTGHAVSAAKRGDRAAWDWLLQRYYPLARRYLMAILDPGDVDDVTQETFVAAVTSIRKLRRYDDIGVEGWLLGIARNKAKDHFRRQARSKRQGHLEELPQDPADIATASLDARQLRLALSHLSADQQEVLVRRFVFDQSLEDVAAATQHQVGAVKSLQHRGLNSLRRHLPKEQL